MPAAGQGKINVRPTVMNSYIDLDYSYIKTSPTSKGTFLGKFKAQPVQHRTQGNYIRHLVHRASTGTCSTGRRHRLRLVRIRGIGLALNITVDEGAWNTILPLRPKRRRRSEVLYRNACDCAVSCITGHNNNPST